MAWSDRFLSSPKSYALRRLLTQGRWLLVGAVVALVLLKIGADIRASWRLQSERARTVAAQRTQIQSSLAQMVANYNAVKGWEHEISKSPDDTVYTVDVKNALIRSDGRPVFFLAEVNDVVPEGDTYYVHLTPWPPLIAQADILFCLQCNSVQAARLLSRRPKMLERYAVVANVSSVRRVEFQVSHYAEGNGEVQVSLQPSRAFIANGRCLDLLFIGDYGLTEE